MTVPNFTEGASSCRCLPRLLLSAIILFIVGAAAETAGPQYSIVEGSGGVPLTVVTAGSNDKPAILFVHGLSQSHYAFHKQFASNLAEDYYLVGFDLRGHGASGKPWNEEAYGSAKTWAEDVAAVLKATGAKRPIIVGWSYGTLVALDYLREFGVDKTAGLLFTGSVGALLPFRTSSIDAALTEEFARVREQQLSNDPRDQLAALGRMVDWLSASPVPVDEREMLRITAARFPAYARRAIYARPLDNQDLLTKLDQTPILIIMGSEDNAALVDDAAQMVESRPAMRFSRYDGAGHSAFLEMPERFNRDLRAFAQRVIASGQ